MAPTSVPQAATQAPQGAARPQIAALGIAPTPDSISAATSLGAEAQYFAAGGPLDAVDEYGNIYVVWQEYSGAYFEVWVDVFCQQALGTYCAGKTAGIWEGAIQLDVTYYNAGAYGDLAPDIAVTQTGTVCASWGSSYYGDVWVECYYGGAWTGDGFMFATYYADDQPAIAFDQAGHLEVVIAVPGTTTTDAVCIAQVTVAATLSGTCYDYTPALLGIYSATYVLLDSWAISCLLTVASSCTVFYADITSLTAESLGIIESSNDFVSTISFQTTIDSETWSTAWMGGWFGYKVPVNIEDGGAACSATSANCAIAYAYDSGDADPNNYVVHYAYSTDGWATLANLHIGNPPASTGSISTTGIAIIGAGSPIVSWNSTTTIYVTGSYVLAPASSAAWGTEYAVAFSGAYQGFPALAGVSTSANFNIGNNIPWRGDLVYASASTTYYSDFYGPALNAPSATSTAFDLGQSTTISVSEYSRPPVAEGFTIAPTTGYTWAGLPTGCSSTANSFLCTPTAKGTYTVSVSAKDTGGFPSTSIGGLTITVNAVPSVSGVASPTPTDAGTAILFTATGSGGTSPVYAWRCTDGTTAGNVATLSHPFTAAHLGVQDCRVWYNDTWSSPTALIAVTVNAVPTVSGSAAPTPTDPQVTITFTATGAGGTTPAYNWKCTDGSTGGNSGTLAKSFTSAYVGTQDCRVWYNDTWNTPSFLIPVTINAPPSVSGSASPATTDAGVPITFTATGAGGTTPAVYNWKCTDGATSGNSGTLSHAFTASYLGAQACRVWYNDSWDSSNALLSVTINADPTVAPSATPNPTDTNYVNTLTEGGAGGTNPTFAWHCSDGFTSTAQNPTHAFATVGTPLCSVWRNDSWKTATGQVTITVNEAPTITAISATPNPVDVTVPTTLSATGIGGTGATSYAWRCTDGFTATSASTSHAFAAAGSPVCRAWYNDTLTSATSTVTVTVDAAPSISSTSATPNPTDVSVSVALSATGTGGTGATTYAWRCTDGFTASSASTSHPFAAPGAPVCRVWYNDSQGLSATTTVSISVNPAPTVVSVSASPNPADVGVSVALGSGGSGGTTPFAYAWRCTDGFSITGRYQNHSFAAAGVATCRVWYNDSVGASDTAAVTITVNADPAISSTSITPSPTDAGVTENLGVVTTGGSAPTTYAWHCTDGFTSSLQGPTHPFASAGAPVCSVWFNDSMRTSMAQATGAINADPWVTSSASPNPTDAGVSVTLTGTGTGGTSALYAWRCTDGFTSSAQSPAHSFTASGSPVCRVWYNDSFLSSTTTVSLTINNPPSVTSVGALPDPTDVGAPVAFSVAGSGGTSATYFWRCTDGFTASVQSPSHPFSTAGSDVCRVWYNDSWNSAPGSVTVTVNPAPAITGTSGTPNPTDVSIPVSLTATGTGGTGATTYAWRCTDAFTASTQSASHAFAAVGSPVCRVWYNDTLTFATATVTITVNAAPAISAKSALPNPTDVGAPVALTATGTGGTGATTYLWRCTDGFSSPTQSTSHTFSSVGTPVCVVWFNDTLTGSAASLTVTVNAAPSVSSSSTPDPTDVSVPTTLSAVGSGGTGATTYAWRCTDGFTSTAASVSHPFASAGSMVCRSWYNDTLMSSSSAVTITVNPTPVATPSANPNPTGTGANTVFSGTFTGGTGPFAYAWRYGDGSLTPSGYQDPTHVFNATGTFTVRFWVNDSVGVSVSGAVSITVTSLAASGSPSTDPVDTGIPVTFTGSVSGGVGPYTYTWRYGDGSPNPSHYSSPTHTFNASGTFSVKLWVNDSTAADSLVTISEVVNAVPTVTASAVPSTTDVGVPTSLTGAGVGGTSATYKWTCTDGFTSTAQSPSHAFASTGSPTCWVWYNDTWYPSSNHVVVTVNADPSITTITGTPSPTDVGVSVTLSLTGSGGSSPFAYAWRCTDGFTSASQSVGHSFATAGSPVCRGWYNDSVTSSTRTVTLTIDPVPSISGVTGTPNPVDPSVPVTFSATVSGGTPTQTYAWRCTDGFTSNAASPTHAFASVGVATCRAWYNDTWLSSNGVATVTVDATPSITAISATPSPTDVTVLVTLSVSGAGGTSPTTYAWHCTDGFTSSVQGPSHAFATAGPETCVAWFNDTWLSSTSSVALTINAHPSVSGSAAPNPTDVGVPVLLTGSGSGGTSASYAWRCTDGFTSVLGSPSHVFAAPGSPVCVVWFNDTWLSSSASTTIVVHAAPSLSPLGATPDPTDVGVLVSLTASGSGGTAPTTYAWHCTDGFTSLAQNPTPTFSSPGTPVCWAWFNDTWLSSSASVSLVIHAVTSVTASALPDPTDAGVPIALSAAGVGGTSPLYAWRCSDGFTSSAQSPSHAFASSGSPVCWVWFNDSWSSSSSSVTLTVNADPSVTASATPSTTDAGVPVALSATGSGGTSPTTYAWHCTDGFTSSVQSPSHAFGSVGAESCGVWFNDTWLSSNQAVAVTVDAPPSIGSISAAPNPTDVGIVVALSVSGTGGTAPTTYAWHCTDGFTSSAQNPTHAFLVAGNQVCGAWYNDSLASSATSAVVVVDALPTVTLSTPTPGVDVGETANVTGSVVGGTGPHVCRWYVNVVLQPTTNCLGIAYVTSAVGTLTVNATVVDSLGGETPSTPISITVAPRPTASISPAYKTADMGQSVLLTSTISGGTGPFTCRWTVNNSTLAGATSCTGYRFVPLHGGNYWLGVVAIDSGAPPLNASSNATLLVGGPLYVAVSPSSVVLDVGMSQVFSSLVSGGVGPYALQWFVNGTALPSGVGSTYTFGPSGPGSYLVGLRVTDVNLNVIWTNLTVTVYAHPSVALSPTATVEIAQGRSLTFSAAPFGGDGSLTYTWFVNGVLQSGASGSSFVFTASATGAFQVNVTVQDQLGVDGRSATATLQVVVVAATIAGPASGEVGLAGSFTAGASGGTSPYAYQWYVDGALVSGQTGPTFSYAPATSGSHVVGLRVADAAGITGWANATLQVVAALSVGLLLSAPVVDLGSTVWFNVTATGGVSPVVLAWTLNGQSWTAPGTTSRTFGYLTTSPGTYVVQVSATDGLGGTASTIALTLVVNPLPSVSLAANTTAAKVGWDVRLQASTTGGTGPLSFSWLLNGSVLSGVSGAYYNFTPRGAGNYSFQVVVTDARGSSASSLSVLVVVSHLSVGGQGTGGKPSSSSFPWWVLALVVIAAVGALLFFLFWRRKKEEPKPRTKSSPRKARKSPAAPAEDMGAAALAPAVAAEGYAPQDTTVLPDEGPVAPPPSSADMASSPLEDSESTSAFPPASDPASFQESPSDSPSLSAPPPPAPAPELTGSEGAIPDSSAGVPMPPTPPPAPAPAPAAPAALPAETQGGVIPAGTPVEMLEAAVGGEPEPHPEEGEFPHCPRCGSPLPSARSECLVCASHDMQEPPAAPAAPNSTPTPEPPSPPGPPTPSVQATQVPTSTATPTPPSPPPPSPAPAPPAPATAATSSSVPSGHATVPTAPGSHPLKCFICGSGLDATGTCPICGVQWAEGSG